MYSLFILVAISLAVAFGVLALLIWANKQGQFDDPEGPKYRIFDDD
jgi:cbb3-type cytochrome oxidase maturation protein